jgi:hypothetical protein
MKPTFVSLLGLLLAAAPAASADVERFEVAGKDVAIYNLAGEVELVRGTGKSVVVHVTRGGDDSEQLEIVSGEIAGRMTLRVLYPSRHVVYSRDGRWGSNSSTSFRVGKDGRFSDGSTADKSGDRVKITSSGSGLEAHADLRIEVPAGQTCSVYLGVGSMNATNIEGDLTLDAAAADVKTSGTKGDLDIDTGSGAVTASGVRGGVDIDTGSGSVDLSDVQGDRVDVDTGSGHVEGSGIQSKVFDVDTGSGGVNISKLGAPEVNVATGSGGVTLELTSDVETLEVGTGSGSVTIRVPTNLGAEVHLETGSGGITSDIPIQVTLKESDTLRGSIGDGKGRIVIGTGSGSVRILKN